MQGQTRSGSVLTERLIASGCSLWLVAPILLHVVQVGPAEACSWTYGEHGKRELATVAQLLVPAVPLPRV